MKKSPDGQKVDMIKSSIDMSRSSVSLQRGVFSSKEIFGFNHKGAATYGRIIAVMREKEVIEKECIRMTLVSGTREAILHVESPFSSEQKNVVECTIYLGPGADLLVSGKRATLFSLDDELSVLVQGEKRFQLKIEPSTGRYVGHITRESLPSEIAGEGRQNDLKVFLRTIERDSPVDFKVMLSDWD